MAGCLEALHPCARRTKACALTLTLTQDESLHPALDEHGEPVHEEDHADPSVLYRAGSSHGQSTTTPRLVVCDLPDAFGTLGRRGLLYRDEVEAPPAPDPLSWGGTVTTAAQDRIKPNAFLQHLHGGVVAGWAEDEAGEEGGEGEGGEEEDAASMVKKMRIEPNSESEDPRVRQSEGQAKAGTGQAMTAGGDGEVGEEELQAAAFNFEGSVRVWSDYLQVAFG